MPGRPLDQQQPRLAGGQVVERRADRAQLAVAVEQVVRRAGGGAGRWPAPSGVAAAALGAGRRASATGRAPAASSSRSAGPGVDAELVGERRPGPAQRAQRVGLPVRPVEGEHEQPPPLLAQRLLGDHRLEVGHEQRGLAQLEPGGEQPFAGHRPQLGEPGDLRLGPRLVGLLGQRRPAPERERLGEQSGGGARSVVVPGPVAAAARTARRRPRRAAAGRRTRGPR